MKIVISLIKSRRSITFMSIEVGSKVQGKVTGITNFGAFVELEAGKTGLVHISEVADTYVKDINEHLSVGEEVEVKVIYVEKDGKIGLSILLDINNFYFYFFSDRQMFINVL